jgi:hypothetical protein
VSGRLKHCSKCGKPIVLLPTKWRGQWWHKACVLKVQVIGR